MRTIGQRIHGIGISFFSTYMETIVVKATFSHSTIVVVVVAVKYVYIEMSLHSKGTYTFTDLVEHFFFFKCVTVSIHWLE